MLKKQPGKPRKSLVGPPDHTQSAGLDLVGYQKKLCDVLLGEISAAAERLTLNRRRPSLEEIRIAGDELLIASLTRAQPIFGEAIAGNLVSAATHEIDLRASDRGVVPACMCACMLARVRYREQLL